MRHKRNNSFSIYWPPLMGTWFNKTKIWKIIYIKFCLQPSLYLFSHTQTHTHYLLWQTFSLNVKQLALQWQRKQFDENVYAKNKGLRLWGLLLLLVGKCVITSNFFFVIVHWATIHISTMFSAASNFPPLSPKE